MSNVNKQRAGASFPHQAHELREVAKVVKTLGLPSLSTERAVARIREIADQIERAPRGVDTKSSGEA